MSWGLFKQLRVLDSFSFKVASFLLAAVLWMVVTKESEFAYTHSTTLQLSYLSKVSGRTQSLELPVKFKVMGTRQLHRIIAQKDSQIIPGPLAVSESGQINIQPEMIALENKAKLLDYSPKVYKIVE